MAMVSNRGSLMARQHTAAAAPPSSATEDAGLAGRHLLLDDAVQLGGQARPHLDALARQLAQLLAQLALPSPQLALVLPQRPRLLAQLALLVAQLALQLGELLLLGLERGLEAH